MNLDILNPYYRNEEEALENTENKEKEGENDAVDNTNSEQKSE